MTALALRLRQADPTFLLWAAGMALVVAIVLTPIVYLGITSLRHPDSGALTLANYAKAFGHPRHLTALTNTALLGLAVSVACVLIAVPLAWGVSRTDMPMKNAVRVMVVAAFVLPPYLGAIGWILLAGPNAGMLNKLWIAATGSTGGIVNIFSFPGLVLVMALYCFPYVFIFTSAALELVSSDLEDAAHVLGAGMLRTSLKITLPIVAPAIMAGAVVTFLETAALFGTPALIAIPARINLATTQIWQFFEYPVQIEVAAAFSMPLVAATVVLVGLQRLLLGQRSFATVTGKAQERRTVQLGPWRWALAGYAGAVGLLAVALPALMLAQCAFSKAWGRGLSFDNLTLRNFAYVMFEHSTASQAVLNSLGFSIATACIVTAIGFVTAYAVDRRVVPWSGAVAAACTAPFVVPGIVMGIAVYAAFAPPPFSLYGTATIIVLAFSIRLLPVAFSSSASALKSLAPELEEAVRIAGGGRMTAIARVLVPVLKKPIAGAWILVMIAALRELSTAVFLVGPKTRIMPVLLIDLTEAGNFEAVAAMGLLLLGVCILVVALGMRLLGRDFMLR